MKERPILFSAPMVRAILAGTKTQTRRVAKGVHIVHERTGEAQSQLDSTGPRISCPYGQLGDRLWVRETFSGPWCMEAQEGIAAAPPSKWGESSEIWYWADGEPTHGDWTRPRPSIHMPRWASRITLEVTGVRVERLQGISEADAVAEGVTPQWEPGCSGRLMEALGGFSYRPAASAYADLWEEINGPGSWDGNPWVWVVEFKRISQLKEHQ